MQVRDIWTDDDFEHMDWHDSPIHSIWFPDSTRIVLDIDYFFEWQLDAKRNVYNFWVSPCTLIFLNAYNLVINFDFGNAVGLTIESISRSNKRASLNKLSTIWDYLIQTDRGPITFVTTGYAQKVRSQPILSKSQILPREQI